MIIKRKTQIILALLLSSVFLFQNCATIISGISQKIPVSSSPSGAKITVDGEVEGHAPIILKLKRKKKRHVIRVEKAGYNPLEIRIARKTSAESSILSILGNVVFGGLGFCGGAIAALSLYLLSRDEDKGPALAYVCMIGGAVLGWAGGVGADFKSGANYTLAPEVVDVTLTKIEGKAQPDLILLDARQLQRVKWIRIRCAPSDGEESPEKN